jgi:UDP-3-O-[3-hydroxymyristoyl] glucosamine N-acyltransferase
VSVLALADRLAAGLGSRWRNLYYRIRGVQLSGYVWMRRVEIPRNFADIEVGAGASLDRGVTLLCSGPPLGRPKLIIGPGTYVNRNTMFDAIEQLVIGRDCAIGPGCYLTDHDHGWEPGTRPLNLSMRGKPTGVGDRVWIGANVTVLKGVTIGDDAVVGAGSVVTKDVPARALAVGVPARVIRVSATPEGQA